jgi:hypothetical protein
VAPSVDTTAPVITVSSPTEGQHLARGRAVSSAFTCADETGGSGVATCAGPGTVDTSVPGARTFSVTATDVAGNSSTKTVNYIVDAPADTTPPAIIITTPAQTPPAPKVSLSGGTSLVVQSSGEVRTTLKCVGTSSCTGTEALTVKSGATPRAARSKAKLTTIAKASYNVAAGKTAEIKLKLTPAGKKLMNKAHGKLKVTLTITPKNDGAKATTRTITLNSKKR